MKKRTVLGSVVMALLMLVSIQLIFLKNVKSDPTIHYGDANVGDFWITELDVSSALEEVNYVSIAHVKAFDDWVCWDEGTGNVTAEWEIDITSEQNPEYVVSYVLGVFNVDKDNICIGSDEFSMTCSAQTGYNLNGILQVNIEFSPEEIEQGSVTLVCLLDTTVYINNTDEAEHFMSIAQDRCVIAVDFKWPQSEPPFYIYRDEANEKMPGMWFWLPDWESKFTSEDEMMTEQTVVFGGAMGDDSGSSQANPVWDLGDIYVDYMEFHNPIINIIAGDDHVNWSRNLPNGAKGPIKVDYHVDTWAEPLPIPRPIYMSWYLRRCNGALVGTGRTIWTRAIHGDKTLRIGKVTSSGNETVYMCDAKIQVLSFDNLIYEELNLSNQIYINILGNQNDTIVESDGWNWNGYCSDRNINIDKFENSVVKGNINDLLKTDDNLVYTFKGDRGETTVELICT